MSLKLQSSVLLFLLCLGLSCGSFAAFGQKELSLDQTRKIFPTAERVGTATSESPVYPIYDRDRIIGYMAYSDTLHPIPGYSGKPISILVGVDNRSVIRGLEIAYHEEPILVAGITEQQLSDFVKQYQGISAEASVRVNANNRPGFQSVDGISGATITVMIVNKTIMSTASTLSQLINADPAAKVTEKTVHAETLLGVPLPESWWVKRWHVLFTGTWLILLLGILFFQDWLVRKTRFFRALRIGFLLVTVFYIGFYHLAQLSIVNILGFFNVLINGFTWNTLMIDPIIFMIWGFIAISILLWGRGVFCGWLCPFGAFQELLFKISSKLKLPHFEFPQLVHERLWAIKYFILILLIGSSLESIALAATLAEVEPFKTVFVLQFQRQWYFILFAVLLLIISMFNSKFYCKYLCPLGAALSFGSHFKVFDWLRRRKECGRPCQACATQCQISSIKPTGEIIDTECHYCLDCQVLYWDEERCPPLVEKAKKRKSKKGKLAPQFHTPTTTQIQPVTVRPSNKEKGQ